MGRAGLTDGYLAELAVLARRWGIDPGRVAQEVRGHLEDSAERRRVEGEGPVEAELGAIEAFGEADAFLHAVASSVKGGAMARPERIVGTGVALAATAALAVVHVVPSKSVSGTPFEAVAAVAAIALGCAALGLAAASRTRWIARTGRLPGPPLLAWLSGCAVLGVAASLGSGPSARFVADQLGGKVYLAAIGGLALTVVVSTRAMRMPLAAGVGLASAGALSLLLNGVWTGAWRPLGGIGDGAANMGIVLLMVGWAALGVAWFASRSGAEARRRVGSLMVSAGRRIAPETSAGG